MRAAVVFVVLGIAYTWRRSETTPIQGRRCPFDNGSSANARAFASGAGNGERIRGISRNFCKRARVCRQRALGSTQGPLDGPIASMTVLNRNRLLPMQLIVDDGGCPAVESCAGLETVGQLGQHRGQ